MICTGCDGEVVCIKITSWDPDLDSDYITEYYCSTICMLRWWG